MTRRPARRWTNGPAVFETGDAHVGAVLSAVSGGWIAYAWCDLDSSHQIQAFKAKRYASRGAARRAVERWLEAHEEPIYAMERRLKASEERRRKRMEALGLEEGKP